LKNIKEINLVYKQSKIKIIGVFNACFYLCKLVVNALFPTPRSLFISFSTLTASSRRMLFSSGSQYASMDLRLMQLKTSWKQGSSARAPESRPASWQWLLMAPAAFP